MKKQKILSLTAAIALMGSVSLYGGNEGDAWNNVYYGNTAGSSLFGGMYNVFMGYDAGNQTTEGSVNTFIGAYSGQDNTTGRANTFIGASSGQSNTTGKYNTFSGVSSGVSNTTGRYNTFSGSGSGQDNTTGSFNTFIGTNNGLYNTTGSFNTFIGIYSGLSADVNSSVFLGIYAGYYATRDNTLYISNSKTESPLIYGEFDTKMLRVNGTMEINSTKYLASKPGEDDVYGYPALRLNAFDLPKTTMDWVIGLIYEPDAEPHPRGGLGFYNEVTDKVPFSIANNAEDYLLELIGSSVVVNYNDELGSELDDTLIGTARLLVNGNIMAAWSGSNEVDDGLKTLVLLSADNSAAGKASDAGFAMVNKKQDFQWNFRTLEYKNAFTATKEGSGGGEFIIQSPTNDYHDAIMKVGGVTIFAGGQLLTPSSRELKTDIKPLDTQAAMDAFHKLQPVTYAYKAHKEEPVVGFIAEDIPDLVATKTRTGIDSSEIVAVLTSVLAETRAEMEAKNAEMEVMKAEIAELKSMKQKVAQLESLLTNLALDTSTSNKAKVSMK